MQKNGSRIYKKVAVSSGLKVVRDPRALPPCNGPVAVTIGNFDGVHLGHQEVLRHVVSVASANRKSPDQESRSVVVSFYPHPSVVLGRATELPLLTPLHQKVELMQVLGVSALVLLRFTRELSTLSAKDFLDRYFISGLGATHAVLGPDTALGRNREGNRDFMLSYLNSSGVSAEAVPFREMGGARISSRRIRELLKGGNLSAANALLGRPYAIAGRVRRGDGRGRTIGVPTANLIPRSQLLPLFGVYASKVKVAGVGEYAAVTNIGVRPTFGGERPSIESHLFSFDGDLYGKRIEVSLVAMIRDEQKFSDVESLRVQITKDIEQAKTLVPT